MADGADAGLSISKTQTVTVTPVTGAPVAVAQTTGDMAGATVSPYENDLNTLAQLTQQAALMVQMQNLQATQELALEARGVYEDARAKYAGDDLAFLGFLCDLTCFYETFVTAQVMQAEGRYGDALQQIQDAITSGAGLSQSLGKLAESPDLKPIVNQIEPTIRPFPPLLGGYKKSIEAELFGYRADIGAYIARLREAAAVFRQAKQLRPSANPAFKQIVQLCTSMAERMEARARNFEPMLSQVMYAPVKGDKILIIHSGKGEAKWRELESLLQERKRQTVVIEKMPDNGMVLIEKCIKYASDCSYAIALFTPDDMVKAGDVNLFQARPNVLFELGWFYGRFGPDKVLILKQDGTDVPSDLAGVVTKNFTKNVEEVISGIEKELPPLKQMGVAAGQTA